MARSSLEALPERQRAAVLANALPRRTQQLPKRLDPFDCTLCASRLKALAASSVSPWLRCWCFAAPTGTGPVQQHVSIGPRRIGVLEAHGTYATRLWHSSVVMARWLASHADAFDGTTVLECGAGTGLCALTLAAMSTAWVLASDVDETGLALLSRSAEAQSLARLRTCKLDICDASPLPPADWLVASDVLYTPQLADALARRCLEIVARGGRAIVADPGRPTRRRFQALIEQHGMQASFLPIEQVTLDDTAPRLLLLHVDGERPVSAFPAHADLEG